MRFFLRQMRRLLGLLLLLLLAIVVGARALADGYGCVRYTSQGQLGNGLVDVRTGARFGAANPVTMRGLGSLGEIAPDGKTMFYFETASIMEDEFGSAITVNLKVMPLPGAGTFTLRRDLPVSGGANSSWSPDSQSIAYTWFDATMMGSHLAITNLRHETLEVTVPDFQDIVLTGFSPDGHYVITSNQGMSPRIGIIWEIDWAAHQLTELMRYEYTLDYNLMYQSPYIGRAASDSVWWSPTSQWLAIITLKTRDNRVIMLDLATKTTHSYLLDSTPYGSVLRWSPDGQYLAVSSTFEASSARFRLDILGINGQTQTRVTSRGVEMMLKQRWSSRDHTFYYFEGSDTTSEVEALGVDAETGATRSILHSADINTIAFLSNDLICVQSLRQNSQLVDLTGEHDLIWLDWTTGCTMAARSSDDKLWIISTAASGERTSQKSLTWLRFDPLTMGTLPLTNFRYIGWSADERSILYATSSDFNIVNSATLSLLDTTTWQSREVIKGVVPGGYLSPDNRWLFTQRIVAGKGVLIMAATDGSQIKQQPLDASWPILSGPIFWSPDSRTVTYEYREATGRHMVDMLGTDGTLWHRFYDLPNFANFPRSPASSVWTDCSANLP